MFDRNQIKERREMFKDEYSMFPSYIDLLTDVYKTVKWYYRDPEYPKACIYDSITQFSIDLLYIYSVFLIALLITIIRYLIERFIFMGFANWLELSKSNQKRFSESLWKCLFYTFTWFYCLYLLKYCYNYFDEPYLIWDDWSSDMIIPFDIRLIYIIECGFYIHAIYATFYMDHKRKDFYIMILHHIVTITLIVISYAIRYHKIGLLILFLHDIADIWLEMAKLMRYLSARKGSSQSSQWQQASYVSFTIFVLSWLICRLYWYPLKVLYTTGVTGVYRVLDKDIHLYIPFNILLWILFGMNIYWFILILKVLFTILTGSESKSADVREDDDDEDEEISPSSNTNDLNKKTK